MSKRCELTLSKRCELTSQVNSQRLLNHKLADMKNYVRSLPGVKQYKELMLELSRDDKDSNFDDMMIEIEGGVSPKEMIDMAELLLDCKLDGIAPLGNFTTCYTSNVCPSRAHPR